MNPPHMGMPTGMPGYGSEKIYGPNPPMSEGIVIHTYVSKPGHKPPPDSVKEDMGRVAYTTLPKVGNRLMLNGKKYKVKQAPIDMSAMPPPVLVNGVLMGEVPKPTVYLEEI
jgi:hypothetical protein